MIISVYSYCGLGDHLVCYGIIKEWAKSYEKILYRSDYMTDLAFNNSLRVYSSIPNVELIRKPIIPVNGVSTEVDWPIANTQEWFQKVGYWNDNPNENMPQELEKEKEKWYYDYQWYLHANVPFNLRWDNFFLERDMNKEKEIYYDVLGLKDNEIFAFIHEDTSRGFEFYPEGYKMNMNYVSQNIKLVELQKIPDVNLLDLTYTLEKSSEIHSFNSGVAIFIDLMLKQHDKLFYHHYIRPQRFWRPTFKLNWKEIKNRK